MRIVAYVVVTTALTFGVQLLAVPLAGLPVQVTGWLYLAVAGPLVVGVTYGLPRRRPRSRGPAHRRDDLPHRRHGRRRRRARHSRPRGDRLGPALHHGGSAGRDRGSVRASGAHRPAHRAAGNPGGAHRARGVGGLQAVAGPTWRNEVAARAFLQLPLYRPAGGRPVSAAPCSCRSPTWTRARRPPRPRPPPHGLPGRRCTTTRAITSTCTRAATGTSTWCATRWRSCPAHSPTRTATPPGSEPAVRSPSRKTKEES